MSAESLRSVAIVGRGDAQGLPRSVGSCRPDGTATIVSYEPERILIETDAPRDEVLMLTDVWDPGWQATVDGTPAEVLRVDHALRGVAVQAGQHRVEFRYRPGWLIPGYLLMGATAGVLAALVTGAARRFLTRLARPSPQPSGSVRKS